MMAAGFEALTRGNDPITIEIILLKFAEFLLGPFIGEFGHQDLPITIAVLFFEPRWETGW